MNNSDKATISILKGVYYSAKMKYEIGDLYEQAKDMLIQSEGVFDCVNGINNKVILTI